MKSLRSDSPIWACFLRLDRGDDTAEPPPWRWLTSQRWSLCWQSTDLGEGKCGAVLQYILHTRSFPTTVSYKAIIETHFHVFCQYREEKTLFQWLFPRYVTKKYWRITRLCKDFSSPALLEMNTSFVKSSCQPVTCRHYHLLLTTLCL